MADKFVLIGKKAYMKNTIISFNYYDTEHWLNFPYSPSEKVFTYYMEVEFIDSTKKYEYETKEERDKDFMYLFNEMNKS